MADKFSLETLALHAGQIPDPAYGSRAVPIHQTTSYVFDSSEHAASLFNLEQGGHLYSRISNPTVAVLENRIAALDGGVACIAASSGMAALHLALTALVSQGDHIVYSAQLYGAAINLIDQTMARYGVESTSVDPRDLDAIRAAIRPNTKCVLAELISNPKLDIFNVPEVAKITQAAGVPLVVDGTFNTPYLCRPLDHGANVVIHSVTKWMAGHGTTIAGAVVDGGNFDWSVKNADGTHKFPMIADPHYSLDGINFLDEFGPSAMTMRMRCEGMYNLGPSLSPLSAFLVLQGLETLHLRMDRHMSNAHAMVEFLDSHEAVAWVDHPSKPDHHDHDLAKQLLPKGAGSIIAFGVKGGRAAGAAFTEHVELASHLANVGDAKTLVIHPGSTTHSHLTPQQMADSGTTEDLIRLSVGLENIDDLKADLDRALKMSQRAVAKG